MKKYLSDTRQYTSGCAREGASLEQSESFSEEVVFALIRE